jgi:hypothetical protein
MIDARSDYSNRSPSHLVLNRGATSHVETRPVLRPSEPAESPPPRSGNRTTQARVDAQLRRVAADIVRSVQSRLPGRIRDLKVRYENEQFVLSGVSTSYYVKQVAQHVAMNALDALMLGRLVNEIEVRSVR